MLLKGLKQMEIFSLTWEQDEEAESHLKILCITSMHKSNCSNM
jgi:hypothetical protein